MAPKDSDSAGHQNDVGPSRGGSAETHPSLGGVPLPVVTGPQRLQASHPRWTTRTCPDWNAQGAPLRHSLESFPASNLRLASPYLPRSPGVEVQARQAFAHDPTPLGTPGWRQSIDATGSGFRGSRKGWRSCRRACHIRQPRAPAPLLTLTIAFWTRGPEDLAWTVGAIRGQHSRTHPCADAIAAPGGIKRLRATRRNS